MEISFLIRSNPVELSDLGVQTEEILINRPSGKVENFHTGSTPNPLAAPQQEVPGKEVLMSFGLPASRNSQNLPVLYNIQQGNTS